MVVEVDGPGEATSARLSSESEISELKSSVTGRLDLLISGELIIGLADLFFEVDEVVVRLLTRRDVSPRKLEVELALVEVGRLTRPLGFAGALPFPLLFVTGPFPFPDVCKTKNFSVN